MLEFLWCDFCEEDEFIIDLLMERCAQLSGYVSAYTSSVEYCREVYIMRVIFIFLGFRKYTSRWINII